MVAARNIRRVLFLPCLPCVGKVSIQDLSWRTLGGISCRPEFPHGRHLRVLSACAARAHSGKQRNSHVCVRSQHNFFLAASTQTSPRLQKTWAVIPHILPPALPTKPRNYPINHRGRGRYRYRDRYRLLLSTLEMQKPISTPIPTPTPIVFDIYLKIVAAQALAKLRMFYAAEGSGARDVV